MDRDAAIKATRNGAIASVISGVLTFSIVTYAIFQSDGTTSSFWNDPLYYVDVAIAFICAIGIYRNSRVAAVFMVVYFLISQIAIRLETLQSSGIVVSLVFFYFFVKAAQGAFGFHKIEKVENPEYRRAPRLALYLGIPVLMVFVASMSFGVLTMTPFLPSTKVEAGSEMWQGSIDKLISNGIIRKDDQIVYFYSEGLVSILGGGQVLTQDRVISYYPDDDKNIQVDEILFPDVASIELTEKGSAFSDTVYEVYSRDPDVWLLLYLSAEEGGDVKFHDALLASVEKARQ